MDEIFKKFLHTGVGLMATAAEQFQRKADELIDKNTEFAEEGKKIVTDFMKDFETQRNSLGDSLESLVDKVLESIAIPSSEEVENLKARVEELEKELEGK